jgi:hypothetical protein
MSLKNRKASLMKDSNLSRAANTSLAVYAPMINTARCIMLLMRAASITWASGKGLGPGNLAPGRINHRCIGGFMYKNPRVTLNGYLREVGPYHPSSAVK